jgi:hypothetical protein
MLLTISLMEQAIYTTPKETTPNEETISNYLHHPAPAVGFYLIPAWTLGRTQGS